MNEKRQSIDANTEINQNLEFSDQNSRSSIMKIPWQTPMNFLDTNEKRENISKQICYKDDLLFQNKMQQNTLPNIFLLNTSRYPENNSTDNYKITMKGIKKFS